MAAGEIYFKPGSNSLFYRDSQDRERVLNDSYNGTGHNDPVVPPFPEGAIWLGGGYQTMNATIRSSIRWRRGGIMRAAGTSILSIPRTPTGQIWVEGNSLVWLSIPSGGGTPAHDSIVGALT